MAKKISRAPAHKATPPQKYKLGTFPKAEAEWISLANEMISWAHKETSFAIEDFPLSHGYSPHKFYKWVKHNEYFADALEFATYMIGSRRERAARERLIDSNIVLKTMPLYNHEYREYLMDKVRAHQESRMSKGETKTQFLVVEIPQITSPIPYQSDYKPETKTKDKLTTL